MSDQTEKPDLDTRPPLGLKRTGETGKVKQSFSHGRSNTVVVEVKKRRILGRPGEAPPAAPEPAPVAEAPQTAPQPAARATNAPQTPPRSGTACAQAAAAGRHHQPQGASDKAFARSRGIAP